METKKVEREIYFTKDGKEFTDKEEAKKHEKLLKNSSYWIIIYKPDLTEGRGWYGKIYLTVIDGSRNLIEDWCYENIGKQTEWVMGCSEIQNWRLIESEPSAFINKRKISVGDYSYEWEEKTLIREEKTLVEKANAQST